MDLDAVPFLNLSPIPELSEIELSTMLERLSNLSDANGDLTDRNVEDIIKEAEDLLDRSLSSNTNEYKKVTKSPETQGTSSDLSHDINYSKENEECSIQELSFDESKQIINEANDLPHNTSSEENCSKHFNSPVESTRSRIYSSGDSTNPIKSTIDSLKEFSSLVEKKLLNSSPKYNKTTKQKEKKIENEEVAGVDTEQKDIVCKTNQKCNNSDITQQTPDLMQEENECLSKSIKFLNCFERLYEPARCTNRKPKIVSKMPKIGVKKKPTKELKNIKKSNAYSTTCVRKTAQEDIKKLNHSLHLSLPNFTREVHDTDSVKSSKGNHNSPHMKYNKPTEELPVPISSNYNPQNNDCKLIQPSIDEKLILKVLEEMEEIKDQVRKVGVITDNQNPEKKMKEGSGGAIERSKPEVESTDEELPPEGVGSFGIKRLEEQFSMLKEKYDYQMEKLEAENFRLREALKSEKKFNMKTIPDITELPQEKKTSPFGFSPDKKITRSTSLENCRAGENTRNLLVEKMSTQREAFSQTENERENITHECKGVGTEEIDNTISEKKTENKENIAGRKKPGKCKPFSDVNIQQLMRQKKTLNHESQLLATLRGLQAELTARDKENKKLKTEIETLKKQTKKTTATKGENCRRCHIGTQTIGFGHFAQIPYNPENFEVPGEFEKENEDLRSRIKALEEDFELLKEKRVTDLQALHQVHEEEMAKLVSKLETQSALTRHLHSLLVNR